MSFGFGFPSFPLVPVDSVTAEVESIKLQLFQAQVVHMRALEAWNAAQWMRDPFVATQAQQAEMAAQKQYARCMQRWQQLTQRLLFQSASFRGYFPTAPLQLASSTASSTASSAANSSDEDDNNSNHSDDDDDTSAARARRRRRRDRQQNSKQKERAKELATMLMDAVPDDEKAKAKEYIKDKAGKAFKWLIS